MLTRFHREIQQRRGAMLPLIALLLPVLIIFLGFSVDLAYMQNTRMELRSATDAAARAGGVELIQTESSSKARTAAKTMAEANLVAGKGLKLRDTDIQIGRSTQDNAGKWTFSEGQTPFNAVRVTGDRTTTSLTGGVPLFFNQFYGGREFEPKITAVSTFLNFDISLVVDRSGSMQGQKLIDLKNAVKAFVDELKLTDGEEKLALSSYASTSKVEVNLTFNYNSVLAKSNALSADGMTAIGKGLYDGLDVVTGSGKRNLAMPVIVLMTDGVHNTGVEPIVPAKEAAAENIPVYTISFGNDADIKRMQDVAEATGGKHYHPKTGAELTAVFREIARTLPVQITQ
jgi:Ca-activated chloride channel homolog